MITNEQKDLLITQYYNRGVLKKEIRSYEVSLWTLLDEFITVLKWSDAEQKGRIENPKMTINIDGTENFEFSIPMYYRVYYDLDETKNGKLIENPNWYTTRNGNLIDSLRKVKVIFNKMTENERKFEFLIINIQESHNEDILTCNVKCENLAFHELGKIGYKINLSPEDFEIDYYKWMINPYDSGGELKDEPIENLDYWCLKAGLFPEGTLRNSSREWHYSVQMNWSSYENGNTDDVAKLRDPSKIYEETFTTAWNSDTLLPTNFLSYREKARPVTVENSNLYNITLTLAETFGVFCKYEYEYDENYHITGRNIIFYNSFMADNFNILGITYPYNSSNIVRTIDNDSLTTKLFVLDAKGTSDDNEYSIMNALPNASKEDYILNFDYLYKTGAITKELYEEIKPYEIRMRQYNEELILLQSNLAAYEQLLPEALAQKTIYERAIDLDTELMTLNQSLANTLDAKDGELDGLVPVDSNNPDIRIVANGIVNLKDTNKGILIDTLKVYETYESATKTLSNLITTYVCHYDENGNLDELLNISVLNNKVYLVYKYKPKLYYDAIVKTWNTKLGHDTALLATYNSLVTDLELKIETTNTSIEELINSTDGLMVVARRKFEQLMGPALREGYWQPEEYSNYGDVYSISKNFSSTGDINADSGTGAITVWDSTLFPEEDKAYYEEGIAATRKNYVCINLTTLFPNGIPSNIDEYSLVFNSNYAAPTDEPNAVYNLSYYAVGSLLLLGFIRLGNNNIPVLVFLGSKNMSEEQITHMKDANKGHARLSIVEKTNNLINGNETERHDIISGLLNAWLTSSGSLSMIYPRIKFSSPNLKTDTSNLVIWYGQHLLEYAKDYYINTRNISRNSGHYMEYFITIKPTVLFKYGLTLNILINYVLSNACTAIYLDAKKVSLENAYPKVSYEVDVNTINTSISLTLYNRLAQIVVINDADLKLENVYGYISEIVLDLDNVLDDTIEIKNYKNKMEDIFSTILAQTEAMKYNGLSYNSASSGQVGLAAGGFAQTLEENKETLDTYLNEYYNNSPVVLELLEKLFTEAGLILASSAESQNKMTALTEKNANILSGFVTNVLEELSSTVYRSEERPLDFKRGDIWFRYRTELNGSETELGRYIAVANSSEVKGNLKVGLNPSETAGFVRTYDGTLASITGAALNVDTVAGTINLEAANEINIRSGKNLYIAADDTVEIVGNERVNIGGTEINLCTLNKKILNTITGEFEETKDGSGNAIPVETTGINLIAGTLDLDSEGRYTGHAAHVFIKPNLVELGASELLLKAASTINLIASRGSGAGTSAIMLDADLGIYVGASAGIRLFSGPAKPHVYVGPTHATTFYKNDYWILTTSVSDRFNYTESNERFYANIVTNTTDYPTVERMALAGVTILHIWKATLNTSNSTENSTTNWTDVTPNTRNEAIRLILTAGASGASIELNSEHLILGYSAASSGSVVELTQEYIVLGVGSTNASNNVTGTSGGLSGVKITNNSIGLAVTNAAVLMDDNGVTVGSGVNLTTQTGALSGSYVRIAPGGVYIGSSGELYIDTTNFLIDSHATGTNNIFALRNGGTNYLTYSISNGLWVHGQILSESFVATGSNGKFMADSSHFGLYDTNGTAILTINSLSLVVGSDYTLSVGGNLSINSTNLVVNPNASGNETLFKAMNGSNGIIVEGDGDTTVTGIINATGGRFINDIYVDGTIHGGTITGGTISGGTITGGSITIINDNTNNGTVIIGSGDNIFTFDQSGNLTIHGALTATSLTVGDGTYLSYSSSSGLNIGNGGLTYTTSGGLIVTGKIHANELWITDPTNNTEQSATEWVNAKVTPEAIWLGVVKHTTNNANATIASLSHIALSDDSITIDSSGSISLNGASLTLTSSGSNVISMTTNGIALSGGTMTLDASSSLSLTSGNTRISLSSSGFSLTGASILVNATGVGEVVAINSYGIGITSANFMVNAGGIILDANSNITVNAGGHISINAGGYFSVSTNHFNINSNASGNSYVISCGDGSNTNFAVDATGGVTLKKLYVDGQNIDFSTFYNAVSISATGWSGDKLQMRARLYNKLNSDYSYVNAGVDCDASGVAYWSPYGLGYANVTIEVTIDGAGTHTFKRKSITMNVDEPYINGWLAAVSSGRRWENKTLSAGESVTIVVPSSTAGATTSFTISAASSGGDSGGGGGGDGSNSNMEQ